MKVVVGYSSTVVMSEGVSFDSFSCRLPGCVLSILCTEENIEGTE